MQDEKAGRRLSQSRADVEGSKGMTNGVQTFEIWLRRWRGLEIIACSAWPTITVRLGGELTDWRTRPGPETGRTCLPRCPGYLMNYRLSPPTVDTVDFGIDGER